MFKIKGMVYTKDFVFAPGILMIEEGVIQDVSICTVDELTQEEQQNYLIPGLVDVHFHGAAGYDFCDGTGEAYHAIESYENRHGITSICPATMTLPIDELKKIVKNVARMKGLSLDIEAERYSSTEKQDMSKLESFRGIHLEGPFISKEKKGAQKEDHIIPPDAAVLQDLQECSQGLIKIVSIAPETEGAIACIADLKDSFCFSIAHTTADYETSCKAIEAGARHVTHLYNAMPVSTHREPSVLGAAADHKQVDVELICDGIHVHPSVVRNTFRIFGDDRVILISDSMRATGMEDGNYTLGGQDVIVKGALAALADGTIAGSVTNLYDCMKKAVEMGIPKESAIKAATINPARSIGIDGIVGSLDAGKRADVLVVDKDLNLQHVMIGGKIVL